MYWSHVLRSFDNIQITDSQIVDSQIAAKNVDTTY
jgi:hypothetical protein